MAGYYYEIPKYRNEWKYFISRWEAEALKRRLEPFMRHDPHAMDGTYTVRSLYFDNYWGSAYDDKLMGAVDRQKWRIRIYNYSDSRIVLERKKKWDSYIYKESAVLTREEFEKLLAGDHGFLLTHREDLCREFYYECMVNLWRPKVIVDYKREPLIQDEGTVRITFDSDVRSAVLSWDIFDPELPTLAVLEPEILVLEVKFTEFLPGLIRKLLPADGQEFTAISKYTLCYEKAHHLTDALAGITKTNRREK